MTNRRSLFQAATAWLSLQMPGAAAARKPGVYASLGLRPVLNFQGPVTTIGASKMLPQIQPIMAEAAAEFAVLEEVKDVVGTRIAALCKTEAALVTSGTCGAISLGTYACLTGTDNAKVRALPDLAGMKKEVIIQKPHRNGYDHAVRSAGVRIVETATRAEFEAALGPHIAMIYFLGGNRGDWKYQNPVSLEDTVALAKKAGVPVLVDAANLLPSWDNIPKLAALGVDLIAFSGGKHICGPQSSGVLAGRKDLIDAAWLNSSPHSDSNGRAMKVNKEEMIGLLAALEHYVKLDFAALDRESERQAAFLIEGLKPLNVKTAKSPFDRTRKVHRVLVSWDEQQRKLTSAEARQKLMEGEPRIAALANPDGQGLEFTFMMNSPGDEKLLLRRLQQLFS